MIAQHCRVREFTVGGWRRKPSDQLAQKLSLGPVVIGQGVADEVHPGPDHPALPVFPGDDQRVPCHSENRVGPIPQASRWGRNTPGLPVPDQRGKIARLRAGAEGRVLDRKVIAYPEVRPGQAWYWQRCRRLVQLPIRGEELPASVDIQGAALAHILLQEPPGAAAVLVAIAVQQDQVEPLELLQGIVVHVMRPFYDQAILVAQRALGEEAEGLLEAPLLVPANDQDGWRIEETRHRRRLGEASHLHDLPVIPILRVDNRPVGKCVLLHGIKLPMEKDVLNSKPFCQLVHLTGGAILVGVEHPCLVSPHSVNEGGLEGIDVHHGGVGVQRERLRSGPEMGRNIQPHARIKVQVLYQRHHGFALG